MGRAAGRHDGRKPEVLPDTPEARDIGMSKRTQGMDSPIPGGRAHITNAPTVRQQVPIAESREYYDGYMQHGVPVAGETAHDRAEMMRGGPDDVTPVIPEPVKLPEVPLAVPVYILETSGKRNIRSSSPRHFQLQASTGEPVHLCGVDPNRVRILLLNESTSSDIRFARDYADLTNGGGALLPWPGNSYLTLETQDELWAISKDSGTPVISVIQEFDGMGAK